MADNVAITAGTGTTIATDDCSGAHYQKMKLYDGTADSTAAIPGDATNGLDVDVTRVSGNVTVVQATGTNLHAVIDTGSTTAVTQATGSNLHAVLDSGSTTAVTQATGSNLHAVLDSGSTTAVTSATAANCKVEATIAAAQTIAVTSGTAANCKVENSPVSGTVHTVAGEIAHDSPESTTKPVYIGMSATAGLSGITLVADNDVTHVHSGLDGVIIVRPHCPLEDIVTGNASNTDGASTQCIAAQSAGIKTYLMGFTLTNSSSGWIYCEIKDGTTAKWTVPLPPQGGVTVNLPIPIPGTAATAWNFDPSAATTTVYCSMIGFKSKE